MGDRVAYVLGSSGLADTPVAPFVQSLPTHPCFAVFDVAVRPDSHVWMIACLLPVKGHLSLQA